MLTELGFQTALDSDSRRLYNYTNSNGFEGIKMLNNKRVRYIDLFCGIGGFHLGAENALRTRNLAGECVFASDIDPYAQEMYKANFGL